MTDYEGTIKLFAEKLEESEAILVRGSWWTSSARSF